VVRRLESEGARRRRRETCGLEHMATEGEEAVFRDGGVGRARRSVTAEARRAASVCSVTRGGLGAPAIGAAPLPLLTPLGRWDAAPRGCGDRCDSAPLFGAPNPPTSSTAPVPCGSASLSAS